jgi:hypothetical protein
VDVRERFRGDQVCRVRRQDLRERRDRVGGKVRFHVHAPEGDLRRDVARMGEQALLQGREGVLETADLPVFLGQGDEEARSAVEVEPALEITDASFSRRVSHDDDEIAAARRGRR